MFQRTFDDRQQRFDRSSLRRSTCGSKRKASPFVPLYRMQIRLHSRSHGAVSRAFQKLPKRGRRESIRSNRTEVLFDRNLDPREWPSSMTRNGTVSNFERVRFIKNNSIVSLAVGWQVRGRNRSRVIGGRGMENRKASRQRDS